MNKQRVIAVLAGLMAVGFIGWRLAEMWSVAAEAAALQRSHAELAAQVRLALSLREKMPTTGTGDRPSEDIMQIARQACRSAALPESLVREITPEGERAIPNTPVMQQNARVSLEPTTPAELAAFLRQWITAQRIWSIERVEISSIGGRGASEARGGSYRAQLVISAVYSKDVGASGGSARTARTQPAAPRSDNLTTEKPTNSPAPGGITPLLGRP